MTDPGYPSGDVAPIRDLGLTVARLVFDPQRGGFRHPAQAGIAIRAGLFVELVTAGAIAGDQYPVIVGEPPRDAELAAAVHAAVERRGRNRWPRWFNHTEADRDAAARALVASGLWLGSAGGLVDTQPDQTLAAQLRINGLLEAEQVPETLHDTVLALLVGGAGTPQRRAAPKATRKLGKAWLKAHTAQPGPIGLTTKAAVDAALVAMRKASGVPFALR